MVSLEGEALLLGIWRNVEDLENSLTLEELELIIKTHREQEHQRRRFMALLQGVDIDEAAQEDIQERFDAAERRAAARLTGKSEAEIDREIDADIFGLDFEIEE